MYRTFTQPGTNNPSPAALAHIIHHLPDPRARVESAISVWRPRTHPLHRASTGLKCFNKAFGELCDATTFGSGTMADVFPVSPVFMSEESECEAWASMESAMVLLDAVHQGHQERSGCIFLHISRLGRVQRVLLEVIPVSIDGQLSEYIIIETSLEAAIKVAQHSSPPQRSESSPLPPTVVTLPSFPPSPSKGKNAKREVKEMITEFEVKKKQSDWVFIADEKRKKRCSPTPVMCNSCGITQTTQKRRGPNGIGTLCNKCGLRWLRTSRMGPGTMV